MDPSRCSIVLGIASRESLLRRYRAIQNAAFCMTGAMELHAVRLLRPDSVRVLARRIAESEGPDVGGPTALFAGALVVLPVTCCLGHDPD